MPIGRYCTISWQIVDYRFKIVDCGLSFASYGCAVIRSLRFAVICCKRYWIAARKPLPQGQKRGTSYIVPVKKKNEWSELQVISMGWEEEPGVMHTCASPLRAFDRRGPHFLANFAPNRYVYPAYHKGVVTNHPLSRLQSSVRGPVLSPTRSYEASTSVLGLSRRSCSIHSFFFLTG